MGQCRGAADGGGKIWRTTSAIAKLRPRHVFVSNPPVDIRELSRAPACRAPRPFAPRIAPLRSAELIEVSHNGRFFLSFSGRVSRNIYNLRFRFRIECPESAGTRMIYKDVEYTLTLVSPGVWRWQFQIGDRVVSGRTEAKLNLLAVRRVQ